MFLFVFFKFKYVSYLGGIGHSTVPSLQPVVGRNRQHIL